MSAAASRLRAVSAVPRGGVWAEAARRRFAAAASPPAPASASSPTPTSAPASSSAPTSPASKAAAGEEAAAAGEPARRLRPSDLINTVSAGVTTAANWVSGSAAVVDPEFTVVAGGLGALLHVKFPDRAAVYTTLGAAVGVAQPVRSSIVTEGGPINAVARKLSGATFFLQKFSTAEVPGDVLLAPKHIGDIATIRMDGSSEYFMARHAYLASTPHLSLSPRVSRIGAGFDSGLINMKVSGKGTLAVTTYGGLLRLVLGPGEVYHVHAKHLVAWDVAVRPAPVELGGAKPAATAPVDASGSAAAASSSSASPSATSRWSIVGVWENIRARFVRWILGDRDLLRVTGPGDVYIASRLEPRFPTLKSLGRSSRSQGALDAPVVVARTTPSPDAAAKTPVARSVSAAAATPTLVTADSATYDDEKAESREVDTLAPDVPGAHRPKASPAPAPTTLRVIDARSGAATLVENAPSSATVAMPSSTSPSPAGADAMAPTSWWDRLRRMAVLRKQ